MTMTRKEEPRYLHIWVGAVLIALIFAADPIDRFLNAKINGSWLDDSPSDFTIAAALDTSTRTDWKVCGYEPVTSKLQEAQLKRRTMTNRELEEAIRSIQTCNILNHVLQIPAHEAPTQNNPIGQ